MILLGTPQVSFDFGIPDWLLALIILGIYLLYRLIKMLIVKYKARRNLDEFDEVDAGLGEDQNDIDQPSI